MKNETAGIVGESNREFGRAKQLLQQFFEGNLSLDESNELLSLWQADPSFDAFALANLEIEQIFRFYSTLEERPIHITLQGRSATLHPVDSPLTRLESSGADPLDLDNLVRLAAESWAIPSNRPLSPENESAPPAKPLTTRKPFSRKDRVFNQILILGIAVLLISVCSWELVSLFSTPDQTSRPMPGALARITAVSEPEFADDSSLFYPEQWIGKETIRLQAGQVELQLLNGTRLVLDGPTVFSLESLNQVFCEKGRLSVEVSEKSKGFEVLTPFMNTRDLGTAFVTEVTDRKSSTHVVEGTVEVSSLSGNWITLNEGIGAVSGPENALFQIRADKSFYIDAKTMARNARNFKDRCFERWLARQQSFAADSSLLFHIIPGKEKIASEGFSLPNDRGVHTVRGCKVVPGCWPKTFAVNLAKGGDFIRLSDPGKRRSFTLITTIRLNDLSRSGNVIFSMGDTEKGALHWQINHLGELQLLLGEKQGDILADYPSPRVFTASRTGLWSNVVTTVDADRGTISHYLEGRCLATLPWKHPQSFDFSNALVGCRRRSDRAPTTLHFNGQVAEFVLLGRVASEEEIRSFSTYGDLEKSKNKPHPAAMEL